MTQPSGPYVELFAALFNRCFGLDRYAKRKDQAGQKMLFGDEPAGSAPAGKHDVSGEPRDEGGRWTAGGKSAESDGPTGDSPTGMATLEQGKAGNGPAEVEPKVEGKGMNGELYSDDKRAVRVDDNGRYTIVPLTGGEPREVRPFGEILPIDRAPSGVAAAVKKQGLRDYVWYGGLAMPKAAAEAIHGHYNGEQDRQKAEYEAAHPGAAERRDIEAKLRRAERMQDDNYGMTVRLRGEAAEELAAWRKKYPQEAAEERRQAILDDAARYRRQAKGAMLYDADGLLSSEHQQRSADELNAKAVELERQAEEMGQ